MPLVVETGAGLPDADAYVSLTEFKAYCANRGYRVEDFEDFAIEASIRAAAEWVDTYYRYKGSRKLASQLREFPREGLTDWSGHPVTGVPPRVKQACLDLAYKGLTEPLYRDLDRGGMVVSESVGPISVTYAEGAPAGKLFVSAANLLKPYVREPNDFQFSPWTEPSTGPVATVGMHDYPGGTGFDNTSGDSVRDL